MTKHIEIRIPDGTPRTRLEDFLFGYFPNLSRMYLRETVRDARCQVNGRHENVGFRVRGGDFVEIELDPSRETAMRPQEIRLDIIFEDAHLLVVNKPAGMLVHPTHRDKTGTLLNALAFYLNAERGVSNAECGVRNAESLGNAECGVRSAEFEGSSSPRLGRKPSSPALDPTKSALRIPHSAFIRPGLVHRLDKETSGLIVVAKSVRVHRMLAKQFQRRLVEKRYLALVEGSIEKDEGVIEGTIGRYADEKRWGLKNDGKHSETRYWVQRRYSDSTLLELEPLTGRTNQLRIHCAAVGHPIIGDAARGGRQFHRLCLHAWKLSFKHPISGSVHLFEQRVEFLPQTIKKME